MRITSNCAECLYARQKSKTNNAEYLSEIRALIDNRNENDTSPYMIYLFNKIHLKYFGKIADYSAIKKQYNDLVLHMEDSLLCEINSSNDPLAKALIMARIGNYIDFSAMDSVNFDKFKSLLINADMRKDDIKTYNAFLRECTKAKSFLLICDNCGEVVLDKLMLKQLNKRFPHLTIRAMVRGSNIINDATIEDAKYVGLDNVAEIITNGEAIAGTIYELLPEYSKEIFNNSDVILAKGQGNYESLSGQGRHIFYAFLCKCDLFTTRFNVPMLTGMFIEEKQKKVYLTNQLQQYNLPLFINICSITVLQKKGKHVICMRCNSMSLIILYSIGSVLLFFSFIKNKEKTIVALKKTWESLCEMLPKFLTLLIFIMIILSYLDEQFISKILGKSTGVSGIIISGLLGSITLMPTVIAYPMAAGLLKLGAGYAQVTMFITTLTMVGIVTLKIEKDYLGLKVTILRNILSFLLAFINAVIIAFIFHNGG